MRQAGRYLPEYRAVRAKAGGFLDLCYTPALAAEVTLQPIRRFGFDAAILFSDILVVPDALGQKVEFVEGEGPRLEPVRSERDLARLNASATRPKFAHRLRDGRAAAAGSAAMRRHSSDFAARRGRWRPTWWGGRARPTRREARLWAYRDPAGFRRLIDLLVEASIEYLSGQVEAGADVLQIFDSWAGSLPPDEFERWVVAPTRRIVERGSRRGIRRCRSSAFRAGRACRIERYVAETGVQGVGCDTAMPLERHARSSRKRRAWSCRAISIRCCWWPAEQALERQVATF